jgi:hypothetical protein
LVAPNQPVSKGQSIEITVHLPAQFKDVTGARLVVLGHVLRSDAAGAAIRIVRHGFIHVSDRAPRATLGVKALGAVEP